jgi:hypothetical protein
VMRAKERTGKSVVSGTWTGALAAYVLERSAQYIQYSSGFSLGALATGLRRRTANRSTSPFAGPYSSTQARGPAPDATPLHANAS